MSEIVWQCDILGKFVALAITITTIFKRGGVAAYRSGGGVISICRRISFYDFDGGPCDCGQGSSLPWGQSLAASGLGVHIFLDATHPFEKVSV